MNKNKIIDDELQTHICTEKKISGRNFFFWSHSVYGDQISHRFFLSQFTQCLVVHYRFIFFFICLFDVVDCDTDDPKIDQKKKKNNPYLSHTHTQKYQW